MPDDDNSPRPQTLAAALAAYDGACGALRLMMAELRECRELLDAVRPLVRAALAADEANAGNVVRLVDEHWREVRRLPAEVRAWAEEP